MTEESVFMITEAWAMPGTFEKYRIYRIAIHEAFEKYHPEYIFHNHAFEWVFGGNDDELPTGIEVVRFDNIGLAKAAIADISTARMKNMEKEVFRKVRCYLSRYAPPEWLRQEMAGNATREN